MSDTDRDELRESFSDIAVTEEEFETVYAAQKAMRAEHATLCAKMDRAELSVPATFAALGQNAQRHFDLIKEVLGSKRYEAVFGTSETDILPVERELFEQENGSNPDERMK